MKITSTIPYAMCMRFSSVSTEIVRLESVTSNPCIGRTRISPCYGIVRSRGT